MILEARESGPERLAMQKRLFERLAGLGTALLLCLCMLKAGVTLIAFPGWDMDPMSMAAPPVGFGPTATLAIDSAMLTLAGAILALSAPIVGRFPAIELLLLFAGISAAAWHGLFGPGASQENLLIGANWCAAMATAASLAHAARIEAVRRIGAASALGFVAFLAVKGAVQVWGDVPETIESFERNREAILAAHGWTPDSFAARAFERRLRDASATGWFGLSNVVATFAAMGVATFAVLLWREAGRAQRSLASVGLGLSLLCLFLAGSKGGFAAAGVGVAIGLFGATCAGRSRLRGALILVGVALSALAAVLARGVIGERLGELSLLFRSQYLSAAARIFSENAFTGVGPANFKDAYLLARNPLSPEEVSSPHSVLFDFASTLGIGGLAWGVLWMLLLALAGTNLSESTRESPALDAYEDNERAIGARHAFRAAALALAAASIGSAWMEAAIATPTAGLARIISLGLALLIAWRVCIARERALRLALVAAAAAGGFHAMIEVTPIQHGSAALFAAMLGLAAATRCPAESQARRGVFARAIPGLVVALLGIAVSFYVGRVHRWESSLLAGSARFETISSITQDLADATGPEDAALGVKRLSEMLGRTVAADRASLSRALDEARLGAGALAYQDLIAAIAADPTSQATRQAASNLSLQLAALERAANRGTVDESVRRRMRSAADLAEDSARLPWRRAAAQAWLSTVRRGIFDLTADPLALEGAFQAATQAAALDPQNPLHAANAARLAAATGKPEEARSWASRALVLNANMRLDPLRQFEPKERAELEAIAKPRE